MPTNHTEHSTKYFRNKRSSFSVTFDNCCQTFPFTYKPDRFVITFQLSFSITSKPDDNSNSLFLPLTLQEHNLSTCLDPVSSQLLITPASNSFLLTLFKNPFSPWDPPQLSPGMLLSLLVLFTSVAFAVYFLLWFFTQSPLNPSALSSTTLYTLFCY